MDTGNIVKTNGDFERRSHIASGADKLIDEVLSKDPSFAGTEKSHLSGQNFKRMGRVQDGFSSERTSVREKLDYYRAAEDGSRGILERILLKGKKEKER